MSLPTVQWKSTPNKTDHLTKGYTSKVLYTYNYNTTDVLYNDPIISTINTAGKNFKGINTLPRYYFEGDDGKGFKITMYFNKLLDGQNVSIQARLIDIDNNISYAIANPIFETTTVSVAEQTLCRYELYINSYRSGNNYYIEGNGSIIYSNISNGGGSSGTNLVMEPLGGGDIFTSSGTGVDYNLELFNKCADTIQIISLIIEEIS